MTERLFWVLLDFGWDGQCMYGPYTLDHARCVKASHGTCDPTIFALAPGEVHRDRRIYGDDDDVS